jgi:hypothetical protein
MHGLLALGLYAAAPLPDACQLAKEPLAHVEAQLANLEALVSSPWRRSGLTGFSPLSIKVAELRQEVGALRQKLDAHTPPAPAHPLEGPVNPWVIAPPPIASPALDGEALENLVEAIARETFPADRLALLAAAAAEERFDTAGARRLLGLFPIVELRLRALAVLAPRIVDVQNLPQLEALFPRAADRALAHAILDL